MAEVRMLVGIGGYRNGVEWPRPGGTIEVPDYEAAALISQGYADPVAATVAEVPAAEVAGRPAPKTTAAAKRRTKPAPGPGPG